MPSTEPISEQLVLKEDQIFVTTNTTGDMPLGGSLGLYYKDTRYLSLYTLTIEGKEPVLLSASSEHNFMANLQLTNPPIGLEDGTTILPNTISLRRNRLINGGMRERIGLYNYNALPVRLRLKIELGADFRDMFDVRGFPRAERGTIHEPRWHDEVLSLSYTGLDRQDRHTTLSFDPHPEFYWVTPAPQQPVAEHKLDAIYPGNAPTMKDVIIPPSAHALWEIVLEPHKPWFINLTAVPEGAPQRQPASLFDNDAQVLRHEYEDWQVGGTSLRTGSEVFNTLLNRSLADLRVLVDQVPGGLLPAAGIPWYSVPFGRDSLITGLQTLPFKPGIAEGTLRYLANCQGKEENSWRDEEPGKILHEMRFGEMAAMDEIPHKPYYGSVDATPLFLMLFVETMRWTNSDSLYNDLLPSAMLALEWIDKYGDLDGDGFVEYECKSRWGLRNQGWKDSYDSLQYRDGKLPEPPIALVEVQGYVYAAKMGMAALLISRGDTDKGARLAREAQVLKERFNNDFWMPKSGFYAQALNGSNRQVPSISSNVGHALYCGIIDDDKAASVVERLMSPDMLCGWGIRTLSEKEPSFNPMSYHNGSVWPHDNGIIAAGMRRYGFHEEAAKVMQQVVEAGIRFKMFRLPELYCGFARDMRYYSIPAEYPVSCTPQAWAAGTILHFCQTMLGLYPDSARNRIDVRPHLLPNIGWMDVDRLPVGNRSLNIHVERNGSMSHPLVEVKESSGDSKVIKD